MTDVDAALHGEPPEPDTADDWQPDSYGAFVRRKAGEAMRHKRPRPKLHEGMVYPGKLHSISGEPEAGKSTVGIWWLLRAIAFGRPVCLIDSEAGFEHTCDLLQSFGADPDTVDKLFHYFPYPRVTWDHRDVAEMHQMLGAVKPVITMFDSSATMLSAASLKENDSSDVTKLWDSVLAPVGREFGCAVLVTDHDAKGGFDSRYSRGSTAKLACVEVGFKVDTVTPFSRDQDGALNLRVTKDRPGCLHRHWRVDVTRAPLSLRFEQSAKPVAPAGGGHAAESLLSVLDVEATTIKKLVDRIVARGGIPLKRDTADNALRALAEQGLADQVDQGKGRPALWCLPRSPAPPGPDQGAMQW